MSNWHFYCLKFRGRPQAGRVFYRLGLTDPVHDDGRPVTHHDSDWWAQNADGTETKLANVSKVNFPVKFPHEMCADEIGVLYHPDGTFTTDPETGQQIPNMVQSDGWHINVGVKGRALRKKLRPFVVKPAFQKREFAGERAAMNSSRLDIDDSEMIGMDVTDADLDNITE